MWTRGVGLFAVAGLMWLSVAPVALAEPLRSLRLRVDPTLIQHTAQTTSTSSGSLETTTSTSTFGLFPSGFALGIGGSFNDLVNAGVSTSFALQSSRTSFSRRDRGSDDTLVEKTDAFTLWLVPYLEIVGGNAAMRGFVSLHAGLGTSTVLNEARESQSGLVGTLGVSGGIHYFFNEHFSIDPHVRVMYEAGSISDVDTSGIGIAVVLGLSTWLGASKAPESEVAPEQPRISVLRNEEPRPTLGATYNGPTEGTLASRLTVGGIRVDLLADVTRPDVIALRFQRLVAAHRGPSLRCPVWHMIENGVRTEVTGARYNAEGAGPGVRESLQSHVPTATLRGFGITAPGTPPASFEVCDERLKLSLAHRVDVAAFFRRFDALLAKHIKAHPIETATEPAVVPRTEPAVVPSIDQAPATPDATVPTPATPVTPTAASTSPAQPLAPSALPAAPTTPPTPTTTP